MKIGIIGTGNVGAALGKLWGTGGHQVTYGSREPGSEKVTALVAESGAGARASHPAEAVIASELVVLATPWTATEETVTHLASQLSGKILIDATNPVLPRLAGLAVGNTTSAGQEVARWAPQARVVKAFNTIGATYFGTPLFDGVTASMFFCGDDEPAKETVRTLITELGFDPVDVGPLSNARWTEALAMLWIDMTFLRQAGPIAITLLRGTPRTS